MTAPAAATAVAMGRLRDAVRAIRGRTSLLPRVALVLDSATERASTVAPSLPRTSISSKSVAAAETPAKSMSSAPLTPVLT